MRSRHALATFGAVPTVHFRPVVYTLRFDTIAPTSTCTSSFCIVVKRKPRNPGDLSFYVLISSHVNTKPSYAETRARARAHRHSTQRTPAPPLTERHHTCLNRIPRSLRTSSHCGIRICSSILRLCRLPCAVRLVATGHLPPQGMRSTVQRAPLSRSHL